MLRALFVAVASLAAAGCTESERANRAAEFQDRPADLTCRSFGAVIFQGRSTGKVTYDEGERISFVDAANGRLTTVEGDCLIVYEAASSE